MSREDPFAAPPSLPREEGPGLIDLLDRLLDRGVVIRGDLWISVAGVDLLFLGAKLVLASPDRIATLHPEAPLPGRPS